MDLKEIQALIKFVAKSGAQEVSLETEDFKINIKTGSDAEQPTIIQAMAPQAPVAMAAAPAPAAPAPAAPAPVDEAPADDNSNYIYKISDDWHILPKRKPRSRCFCEGRRRGESR